jgi:NAD(P)-dependent dehydrogenase (short-subunit alcohol dehydrogenase family)
MNTSKKIALITGANKGLGLETAKQLAEKGIKVILTARDAAKGKEATESLKSKGLDVEFIKLDTSVSADITAAADYVDKTYGHCDHGRHQKNI